MNDFFAELEDEAKLSAVAEASKEQIEAWQTF